MSAYSHYQSYQSYRPTRPPQKSRRIKRYHIVRAILVVIVFVIGFSIFNSHNSHAGTVKALSPYTKAQTVCLDAGHGGVDPGATTNDGSITERDINLIVAQKVEHNLEAQGYRVFMTRTSNSQTLTNHDRYTYCNNQHATIMVSIHHNYFTDSSVDYSSALFYKNEDQALATSILNSVSTTLNLENDGISQFEDGVLSESTMPAALSEGFFITSDYEYNQLTASGSTRLSDEATAITKGITTYFAEPSSQKSKINTNPQIIERDDSGQ